MESIHLGLKNQGPNGIAWSNTSAAPERPFEMINKGWLVDYNIGEEKQYLRGAVALRY